MITSALKFCAFYETYLVKMEQRVRELSEQKASLEQRIAGLEFKTQNLSKFNIKAQNSGVYATRFKLHEKLQGVNFHLDLVVSQTAQIKNNCFQLRQAKSIYESLYEQQLTLLKELSQPPYQYSTRSLGNPVEAPEFQNAPDGSLERQLYLNTCAMQRACDNLCRHTQT